MANYFQNLLFKPKNTAGGSTPTNTTQAPWKSPNFQTQVFQARNQTNQPPMNYGDQLYVGQGGILTNRSDNAAPLYWDLETKQATTKVTPVPYRYTGEKYALVNNQPVPVYEKEPTLISKTVGAPLYWDPWKNTLTDQQTSFPVYESTDAQGKKSWGFTGSKPYTNQIVEQTQEPGSLVIKGPTGEDMQAPVGKLNTPEAFSFYLDAGSNDILTGTLSAADTATGRPILATIGSFLNTVKNVIAETATRVTTPSNLAERLFNAVPASFGVSLIYNTADLFAPKAEVIKPKSQAEIDAELKSRGYFATTSTAEMAVPAAAVALATKNVVAGGFLGLFAKPLAGMVVKNLIPVIPGTSTEINNSEVLKGAVASGKVEWLYPDEFNRRAAIDSFEQTKNYIGSFGAVRGSSIEELATKYGVSYDEETARLASSQSVENARALYLAASGGGGSVFTDRLVAESLAKRADEITQQSFIAQDPTMRREALNMERLTFSVLSSFDPYFQWTFADRPEMENKFLDAVASMEVRLGRRLTYTEIWRAKDYFSDPATELVGDMIFDWTNVLQLAVEPIHVAGKTKILNPVFGKISEAIERSPLNIAGTISRLVDPTARAAANKLAHSFNEVAVAAAMAVKRSTVMDKKAALRSLMTELGNIASSGQVDREALSKLSMMPEEFAARQQRILIHLGNTLSDPKLEGAVGPNMWGELVDVVSDEVYQRTRESEMDRLVRQGLPTDQAIQMAETKALEASNNPTNLTIGLAQKAKDNFLEVHRAPIPKGIIGGAIRLEDNFRRQWVKFVLAARPAWVFRNWVDNLFRLVVSGTNPFDALDLLNPVLTNQLSEEGILLSPFTETFARQSQEMEGKTFAQRMLEGYRPRSIWDLFTDNVNRVKELRAAKIAALDESGNLLKRFGARVSAGFETWTDFVTDFNAIVEYASRGRLFQKAYHRNVKLLSERGAEIAIGMLRDAGITDERLLQMVRQSWATGNSPSELKNMLDSVKLGGDRHAVYFIRPVVDALLQGLPPEQRSAFILHVSERLRQAMETARLNNKPVNERFVSDLFNDLIADFDEKFRMAAAQADTRTADDVAAAVGRAATESNPDPIPANMGTPPVETPSIFFTETRPAPDALRGLRSDKNVKATLSNFRDSIGERATIRVSDLQGRNYSVGIEDGKVILTLSDKIDTLPMRDVRANLRSAIGDVILMSSTDTEIFAGRNFLDDFDLFLRDPEVLKRRSPAVFNWLAEKVSNEPRLSNILNAVSRGDYLKYLDFVDGSMLNAEVADFLKNAGNVPASQVVNMMPESYHQAGQRQRQAVAGMMRASDAFAYGTPQKAYVGMLDDAFGQLRSRIKRFLATGWPAPTTKSLDMRSYYWKMYGEIGEKIYTRIADLADEAAQRIGTMTSEEMARGAGFTLDSFLRDIGLQLDFDESGKIRKILLTPEITGQGYKPLHTSVIDPFIHTILGSHAENLPDLKKLFTDAQFDPRVMRAMGDQRFADFLQNVDTTFRSVNHKLEIRQDLYDAYEVLQGPNKPATLDEWKAMVDVSTNLMESMARPWMDNFNGTVEEFWDTYLSAVRSMDEVPQHVIDRGGMLRQAGDVQRQRWILKSQQVAQTLPQAMKGPDLIRWLTDPAKRGVRKAELEELGIADWIKAQGDRSITKAELVEAINEAAVVFVPGEIVHGKPVVTKLNWELNNTQMGKDIWFSEHPDFVIVEYNHTPGKFFVENMAGMRVTALDDLDSAKKFIEGEGRTLTTKYSGYALPGGQDYHEILLTTNPIAAAQKIGSPDLKSIRKQLQDEYHRIDREEYQPLVDELGKIVGSPEYAEELTSKPFTIGQPTTDPRIQQLESQISEAFDRREAIRAQMDQIDLQIDFQSDVPVFTHGHWNEKNFFAHMRASEHETELGGRAYVIEEIQSDLHQQGRKGGYATKLELTPVQREDGWWKLHDQFGNEVSPDIYRSLEDAQRAAKETTLITGGVPDFPYKKNWHTITFKRGLEEAVKAGDEYITWTTGRQQFERWGSIEIQWKAAKNYGPLETKLVNGKFRVIDNTTGEVLGIFDTREGALSHVTDLRADSSPDGGWDVWIKHQGNQTGEFYFVKSKDDLANLPGEAGGEWVDGIWENMNKEPKGGSYAPILEGMTGFYDQILPQDSIEVLRKMGIKDAKVEDVRITSGYHTFKDSYTPEEVANWAGITLDEYRSLDVRGQRSLDDDYAISVVNKPKYVTVHGIKITDAMRQSVLGGQYLYQLNTEDTIAAHLRREFSDVVPDNMVDPITDAIWRKRSGMDISHLPQAQQDFVNRVVGGENLEKWFGGSKVVDANGKPLVVYHGTNKEFQSYDINKAAAIDTAGFYFTKDPGDASMYAKAWGTTGSNVQPVYLRIDNPADAETLRTVQRETGLSRYRDVAAFKQELIKRGYDGIITGSEYVAFKPEQIKSVFNRGTFDPNDARILYQRLTDSADELLQSSNASVKGATLFQKDGKAILYVFKNGDISTVVHEFAHIYRRVLTDLSAMDPRFADDMNSILRWSGQTDWTIESEEKFARAFERYLYDGVSPNQALQPVFSRMKGWMRQVYQSIQQDSNMDQDLDRKVDGRSMREIFDGWFNYNNDTPQATQKNFRDEVSAQLGIQLDPTSTKKVVVNPNISDSAPEDFYSKRPGMWRVDDPAKIETALYGDVENITEKNAVQLAKSLRDISLIDEDSGLLNGNAYRYARQRVKPDSGLYIAHVDVDGLKAINTAYSMEAGDNTIKALGGLLNSDKNIEVYRTGGDEISLVIKANTPEEATALLESLRTQADSLVYDIPDQRLKAPQFSFGIGQTDDAAESALLLDKESRRVAGLRGQVVDGNPQVPSKIVPTTEAANAIYTQPADVLKSWYSMAKKQEFVPEAYRMTIKTDIRDTHAARKQLQTLRDLSMTDTLTGAKSKIGFMYDTAPRKVISVDANGLKYINDNFDHAAGNELIKGIYQVINDALDESGSQATVGRMSGTNFVIGLTGDPSKDSALIAAIDKINREGSVKIRITDQNGSKHTYAIRIAYAEGESLREANQSLNSWVGELKARGIYAERGARPAEFTGPGSNWFDYGSYRQWESDREIQAPASVSTVDLTPDELAAVQKIADQLRREQVRQTSITQLRAGLSKVSDLKLATVARMSYSEMLYELMDMQINSQVYGTDLKDALMQTVWGATIAPHLPDINPAAALVKELQAAIQGKGSSSKLGKALKESLITTMERGINNFEPHPYSLEKLGMTPDVIEAANQAWAARGLDPETYLSSMVASQQNADQLWSAFINSIWYGDRSVGEAWGQFAKDPAYFSSYLSDMIGALRKNANNFQVPDSTVESLEFMLWQVQNYRALVSNYAEKFGTIRSRMLGDGTIPLSPTVTRLPEGYQSWFFGNTDNLANLSKMGDALKSWKDDILSRMRSGELMTDFNEEDILRLTENADSLVRLRQTLNNLAIYGPEADLQRQIKEIFGWVTDNNFERKMVDFVDENGKRIREWQPLEPRELDAINTLRSNLEEQSNLVQRLGFTPPEGALPKTNRYMIDYGNETNLDAMFKHLVPFWMFSSRSFPFWIETLVTHPQILAHYNRFIQYTKRTQYQEGITTSDGRQLPSLVGYIRIPGTEMWFNPTAALSFRYVVPILNSYQDEYEGESIMSRAFYYLYDYGNLFGVSLSPFMMAGANLAGYLKNQPVSALVPAVELLPPWWQNSLRDALYKTFGDSDFTRTTSDLLVGSEVPWMDYIVERRMLANVVEKFDGLNDVEKLKLAKEATAAIKMREAHPLWQQTKREIQTGELIRTWAGYFTGVYAKEFTDGEIQLLALRNDINILRDTINDQIGAEIIGLDPSAENRYEHYKNVRYYTAEGYVHQVYNSMRYTQVPDLTEASGFRTLTGEERRDYITNKLYTDEVTKAYFESASALQNELQARLQAAGVGAPSEVTSSIWDWYNKARVALDNDPMYKDAWRTWSFGYKPESMLEDYFRSTWWQIVKEGQPKYDPATETYDEYQVRLEEWKQALPSIAQSLASQFEQQLPGLLNVSPESYQRRLRNAGIELPGNRQLNIKPLVDKLMQETTYEGYQAWDKQNDTPLQALNKAWQEMYWDPYWDALRGLSGYQRTLAERQYLAGTPKPSEAELIDWVVENYGDKFDPADLSVLMKNTPISSVEERIAPQSDEERSAQKVWDILAMAGPNKKALQDEFERLGGYWSDVSTWYNVGGDPAAWADPEKFQAFYDKLKQAATNLGLSEPSDQLVQEWATAQDLDAELKRTIVEQLGADINQVMVEYWNADSATRRAMRKKDPRIDQYYNIRDYWASANPIWAKYYVETKASSTSTSGGSTSAGSKSYYGGTSGSRRYYNSSGGGGSSSSLEYGSTLPMGYRSTLRAGELPGKLGKGGYGRSIRYPLEFLQIIGPAAQEQIDNDTITPATSTFLDKVAENHPEFKPIVEEIKMGAGGGSQVVRTK